MCIAAVCVFDPHKSRLLGERDATPQQQVRWHAAQMLPRLPLILGERDRVAATLIDYLRDPRSSSTPSRCRHSLTSRGTPAGLASAKDERNAGDKVTVAQRRRSRRGPLAAMQREELAPATPGSGPRHLGGSLRPLGSPGPTPSRACRLAWSGQTAAAPPRYVERDTEIAGVRARPTPLGRPGPPATGGDGPAPRA
jgi:hypothetical protein